MIRASQEHGPRCDTGDLDDLCPDCLAELSEWYGEPDDERHER